MTPRPGLSDEGTAIWEEVCRNHQHLTDADAISLARYCEFVAQWQAAMLDVNNTGRVAVSENGGEYMTAALQAVLGLEQKVIRLERELGIIQSTRPGKSAVDGITKAVNASAGKPLQGIRLLKSV